MSTLLTLLLGLFLGFGAGYIACIVCELPLTAQPPDLDPIWLDAIDAALDQEQQ